MRVRTGPFGVGRQFELDSYPGKQRSRGSAFVLGPGLLGRTLCDALWKMDGLKRDRTIEIPSNFQFLR